MMPAGFVGQRDEELLAEIQVSIGTGNTPGLIDVLFAFCDGAPRGYRPAESAVFTMLRDMSQSARDATIQEVLGRAAGQDVEAIKRLGVVLGLTVRHLYPYP